MCCHSSSKQTASGHNFEMVVNEWKNLHFGPCAVNPLWGIVLRSSIHRTIQAGLRRSYFQDIMQFHLSIQWIHDVGRVPLQMSLYRGVCSFKQTNENEYKILKYRFLHCIFLYLPCSIQSDFTELRAPHFRLFWNIKQYVLSLGTWLANQVPDVISKCAWFFLSENSPQLGRTFACFRRKIRFLFRHKKYILFQAVFCFLWVNIFFDWGEILPAFAEKYVFFPGTKNTFSFRLSLARGFGFIWVNIFFNWVEVLTASAENSFSFQAQTIRSLSGFDVL